jgi:hypothetical protein
LRWSNAYAYSDSCREPNGNAHTDFNTNSHSCGNSYCDGYAHAYLYPGDLPGLNLW